MPAITIDAFGELTFATTSITAGSSMSISSAGVISTNLSNNASAGLTINNATGQIGLNCKDANKYYKTNATGVWECSGLVTNDIATALGLTTGSTPKCDAATGKLHWTGSTFNCQTDKDTMYSAGTGITKSTSGNTAGAFSLDASYMREHFQSGKVTWSLQDTGLTGSITKRVDFPQGKMPCNEPIVQLTRTSKAPTLQWDVGMATEDRDESGFTFKFQQPSWANDNPATTRGVLWFAFCPF